MLEFSGHYGTLQETITGLFGTTFTASEGAEEGALIAALACRLMAETAPADLRVVTAREGDTVVGGIIFSRLSYDGDDRTVFVLGPVAVATERQGLGIGQRLIRHGLDMLGDEGVDIVVTYGDPEFYGRVGFRPLKEADVPAPFPLQHPEGWLGQSLNGQDLKPLGARPRCVAAFNDPAFW